MQVFSTKEVAMILGVRVDAISRQIWLGKIDPPAKNAGNYLWQIKDIESAAWALGRFAEFKVWQSREGGEND